MTMINDLQVLNQDKKEWQTEHKGYKTEKQYKNEKKEKST